MKQHSAESAHKETSRLEAFSDAVFAIAITLLVLDLVQILHPQNKGGLKAILLDHGNTFLSFTIGFLTILTCWINHHLVFSHIKKTTGNLVWVNGFVLLVVSFTPFPTSIIAEYCTTEPRLAMAIFGFNYLLMSIAAWCVTAYVYKKELIEESSRELFRRLKLLYKYSIIYTALVFFICMVSVPVAVFFYCILFAVFAFPAEVSKLLPGKRIRVLFRKRRFFYHKEHKGKETQRTQSFPGQVS